MSPRTFAFSKPGDEDSAIYAFSEMPENRKGASSDEAQIKRLYRISKTHRRHYFQQSEYTMCMKFDHASKWSFVPYQDIETRRIAELDDWPQVNWSHWSANIQDVVFKIALPAKIRLDVLERLDEFNLNAFSLFGSEESLMETLAFKELDLAAPANPAE